MAFLVICAGITILQMSKVDPTEFKLDRRSTILLQASRKQTEAVEEKSLSGLEEPGIDTLRGSFGTVGSIIRARTARRFSSQSSRSTAQSSRLGAPSSRFGIERGDSKSSSTFATNLNHYGGMRRHQLFDPPVPNIPDSDNISLSTHPSMRKPAIKFVEEDVVHSYHRGTVGKDDLAIHEHRVAPHGPSPLASPRSYVPSLPENVGGSRQRQQQSPINVSTGSLTRFDSGVDEPRSAPAGVGVAGSTYLDPFEGLPASATLPSSTLDDSADSRRPRRTYSRTGSSRDYPKGDRADDAEESLSLWDPRQEDIEEPDVATSPESSYGTIRLVGSSRAGRI